MLHFPFLQTPVSMIFPVPPSQVCPSVLAPEAAAALPSGQCAIDLRAFLGGSKLTIRVTIAVGVVVGTGIATAAPRHGKGMSGQHGGNDPSESVQLHSDVLFFSGRRLHRATNELLSM